MDIIVMDIMVTIFIEETEDSITITSIILIKLKMMVFIVAEEEEDGKGLLAVLQP
jgi:hypothetical protein